MNNPWDLEKWGVRVLGPDSVLAAHSFEEACQKASELNKQFIHIKEDIEKTENKKIDNRLMPIIYAQVDVWENIAGDAPHDPDRSDWNNVC